MKASYVRQFLRVYETRDRFAAVSEPMHAARTSKLYDTQAEAQAYIDGYEARDKEDDPLGEDQELYVTGVLDEVEFMGPMPDQHSRIVYGPFENLEVAKYHARTLSTDPNEAVILPVRKPS